MVGGVEPGDPDGGLVDRARDGDDGAFAELVHRHTSSIYRVVLRIVGDPAEAEDVTQEAFLRAFRGLPRFRGDALFTSWLHRIAINAAWKHLRRLGRSPILSETEETVDEAVPSEQYEEVRRAEERVAVRRALGRLPRRQRTAVILRMYEDKTYVEIAEIMGGAVNTAKANVHFGLRRLTSELKLESFGGWDHEVS